MKTMQNNEVAELQKLYQTPVNLNFYKSEHVSLINQYNRGVSDEDLEVLFGMSKRKLEQTFSNMFYKYGVKTRQQLVAYFKERGLI